MRQSQTFEVKLAGDSGNFEGIASVYGNVDSYGDVVEPGAFTKTISERGSSVPILWQHSPSKPIGKGQVYDAGTHLAIKGRILENIPDGAAAMSLLREGIIDGLSIGYLPMKDAWDSERKVRLLKEVKLYEVSIVTFPANEQAVLTGVKSLDSVDEASLVLHKFLTDIKAGKTISAATREKIMAAIDSLQSLLAEEADTTKSIEPLSHSTAMLTALREIRDGK